MQWREHSLSFERMMLTDTELSVLGTNELKRNLAGWCLEGGSARVFAHFGLRPSPWR